LQDGYDETAKAWKARFGVPYSVCGCMMDSPAEKVVEKGKTSLKKVFKIGKGSSHDHGTSESRYGKDANHPELVTSNVEDADSSHPSDHNLHRESLAEGVARLDRVTRQVSSRERAAKALEGQSGTDVDQWQKLQAERKQARSDHIEAFTEDGDAPYQAYWGVSANVPFG
jgi:hypothetical protein